MSEIYYYNIGTKALHIEGFCKNYNSFNRKCFSSYFEAVKFSRGQIYFCADCEKMFNKVLSEYVEKKNTK